MASSAEREIRDDAVAWFHHNEPRGRVVHELPLSGFSANGRADLGIIFPDTIVLIEIKSERDKLTLLEKQFLEMSKRCHDLKIICHEKWFESDGGLKAQSWINWSHKEHLWTYPDQSGWIFERYKLKMTPNPYLLLNMLHVSELRDCYRITNTMASSPKLVQHGLQLDLADKLTGRQIRNAVCACLRARKFAEADSPIPLMLGADVIVGE